MNIERWAHLVPELSCSNFVASLAFYRDALGFSVRYVRPENNFAYLELGEAQLMLEQENNHWLTDDLVRPYGRGMNLQIEVDDVESLRDRLIACEVSLFRELTTTWYRQGDIKHGQREFLVQDPDGYLLRFCQFLGVCPLTGE